MGDMMNVINNSQILFLTGMYRAGGKHIAECVARLCDCRGVSTANMAGSGDEDQAINPFTAAVLFPYGHLVLHQHTRAFTTNKMILNSYNVKPVVLVRNLADTLISVVEHVDRLQGTGGCIPGLYIPAGWATFTQARKINWAIYNVAPWQISFFVSWYEANIVKKEIECLWVKYSDFYADQETWLRRICAHIAMPPHEEFMEGVIASTHYRRVGISGRGESLLRPLELVAQSMAWGNDLDAAIREHLF